MDKNKMLIDATHPEETRVVAVRNGRVEEFDFESAARKLLRGNIYLAKVTRVEPSLQAAFIDYGGNRHGFLAFNEIHPDYYQIPVADRELLKQEEAEAELRAEAEADERARSRGPRRRRRSRSDRSGGEGRGPRVEARDEEQPSDVETFEDGYRTSGGSDDDAEPRTPAQPHRHFGSADDALHAEPEPQPTALSDGLPQYYDAPLPAPGNDTAPSSTGDEPVAAGPKPPVPAWPKGDPRAELSRKAVAAHTSGRTADDRSLDDDATAEASPGHEFDEVEDLEVLDDDSEESGDASGNGSADDETVEQVATEDDALEELPERPRRRARQYKIQEVIKRRQIMLVQVVKEERGNKGAALTTYISLAGRYTVLMPNTARGGGISRKITQPQDRKRLKAIAEELDVEEGMGLIIRTAGAARTKQEIKRDYDYLMRLWESVRDLTLSSTAPCLVYEEGNIIKRAIRDLYSKDFDQIVVAGDSAHHEAQDFMEMLMPGSGNHVANYRAPEPLFARYGIERQLNALFSPYVTLRSGGYIVINQTEALVSVDVNSGKSTREFSIEETALNTNLEAAEEIARQLKLRDLAGLIVVDFIDMEEKRNNRAVERRLKDALRHDRARIQVGRISHFGLLEMSRQRLRAGVLEGSTSQCPHCQGTGIIRSIESVALAVLRGLEDQLLKQPSSLVATTTAEVALYILNHKRAYITDMEHRYGVTVRVEASERMQGANFGVERIATPATAKPAARAAVSMEWGFDRDEEAADEVEDSGSDSGRDEPRDSSEPARARSEAASEDERRGRRRRRRRGRRDREGTEREALQADHLPDEGSDELAPGADDQAEAMPEALDDEASAATGAGASDEGPEGAGDGDGGETRRRGRRRGRRGGRSRRREGDSPAIEAGSPDEVDRHEWGIAEFARPGADQPSTSDLNADAPTAIHLVSSVEIESKTEGRGRSRRTRIVESIDAAADDSPYALSSEEAIRRAVTLAGGTEHSYAEKVPLATDMAAASDQPHGRPDMFAEAPSATEPEATVAREPETTHHIGPAAVTDEVEPPAPVESAENAATAVTASSAPEQGPAEVRAIRPPPAAMPIPREPPAPAPLSNGNAGHTAELDLAPDMTERHHENVSASSHETAPPRPARRGWWQRRFGGSEE